MYILVTYDISTDSRGGAKRLRRIAKACLDYGQRVQFSVFECWISQEEFVAFRARLIKEMDPSCDSLRFYLLGDKWERKVEHYGTKITPNLEDPLIV